MRCWHPGDVGQHHPAAHVHHGHQVRAQVGKVEPIAGRVQAQVVEAGAAPAKRQVSHHPQWQIPQVLPRRVRAPTRPRKPGDHDDDHGRCGGRSPWAAARHATDACHAGSRPSSGARRPYSYSPSNSGPSQRQHLRVATDHPQAPQHHVQARRLGRVVALVGQVGPVHDGGDLPQDRVGEVLAAQDRLEAAVPAVEAQLDAAHVERRGARCYVGGVGDRLR